MMAVISIFSVKEVVFKGHLPEIDDGAMLRKPVPVQS
jgi:hypothetical protein